VVQLNAGIFSPKSCSISSLTRARKSVRISSLVRCFRPHLRNSSLFVDWLAPKKAGVIGR
jgi:hypothetical protein